MHEDDGVARPCGEPQKVQYGGLVGIEYHPRPRKYWINGNWSVDMKKDVKHGFEQLKFWVREGYVKGMKKISKNLHQKFVPYESEC